MSFEIELKPFVITIHQYLRDFNDSRLKPFLQEWPAAPFNMRQTSPNQLPVLSYLSAAVNAAHDDAKHIIEMLISLSSKLTWGQTYTAEDFGSQFLLRYGWTELMGLRGPLPSERIACGFLLLGPQVEYPRHSHAAREIYVPMTEGTLWQRGNHAWTGGVAGRPRQHASWEWHAMRTGSQPLLALYLWRGGNLAQKSRVEKSATIPKTGGR